MDQAAFFFVNHTWTSPIVDPAMAVASSWAFWWPILLVAGLIVLAAGGFRARMMLLAIGLSIGLTDGVVVSTLKKVVGRPRPHEVLVGARTLDLAKAHPRLLALGKPLKERFSTWRPPPERGNSFPSGHTSNTFALAMVVTMFYPRRGWLAFIPAAIVGYSRVYVGSHWPSDVLISCFLGAGLAWLVVRGMDAAWRKWGGRRFASLHGRFPSLLG